MSESIKTTSWPTLIMRSVLQGRLFVHCLETELAGTAFSEKVSLPFRELKSDMMVLLAIIPNQKSPRGNL